MKVTCKKTNKDITSKVIKAIEKSITKGKFTIKTVYSSDPELNDNMCETFTRKLSNTLRTCRVSGIAEVGKVTTKQTIYFYKQKTIQTG